MLALCADNTWTGNPSLDVRQPANTELQSWAHAHTQGGLTTSGSHAVRAFPAKQNKASPLCRQADH